MKKTMIEHIQDLVTNTQKAKFLKYDGIDENEFIVLEYFTTCVDDENMYYIYQDDNCVIACYKLFLKQLNHPQLPDELPILLTCFPSKESLMKYEEVIFTCTHNRIYSRYSLLNRDMILDRYLRLYKKRYDFR